jgi:hypothetical protein
MPKPEVYTEDTEFTYRQHIRGIRDGVQDICYTFRHSEEHSAEWHLLGDFIDDFYRMFFDENSLEGRRGLICKLHAKICDKVEGMIKPLPEGHLDRELKALVEDLDKIKGFSNDPNYTGPRSTLMDVDSPEGDVQRALADISKLLSNPDDRSRAEQLLDTVIARHARERIKINLDDFKQCMSSLPSPMSQDERAERDCATKLKFLMETNKELSAQKHQAEKERTEAENRVRDLQEEINKRKQAKLQDEANREILRKFQKAYEDISALARLTPSPQPPPART